MILDDILNHFMIYDNKDTLISPNHVFIETKQGQLIVYDSVLLILTLILALVFCLSYQVLFLSMGLR